jgi:hypothetical protein
MAFDFSVGIQAVFKLDNAAGSLTDVSVYCNKVDYNKSAGAPPATTFGARAEDVLPGAPSDGTISETGLWDEAQDAIFWASLSRQRSYEYGPQGSTGGYEKNTGECIGTAYSITGNTDGSINFSASQQMSDTQTVGAY